MIFIRYFKNDNNTNYWNCNSYVILQCFEVFLIFSDQTVTTVPSIIYTFKNFNTDLKVCSCVNIGIFSL